MRIACLENHVVEGPGQIADWAELRGFDLMRFPGFSGSVPRTEEHDAIVIMGGPMSVNDADRDPRVSAALQCVGSFLEAGKAVFGVCLGAQMMAKAAGGAVNPGPQKEIGWFPVAVREPLTRLLPDGTAVFHWHGEVADVPVGCEILAATPACRAQAFRLAGNQLGFQFHLEVSAASLDAMLSAFAEEVSSGGPGVQTAEEMRQGLAAHGENCRHHLFRILDDWAGG